ncbi:MAG TPA: Tol-Pal system beta propeller repeat protein TolB [Thermoanaerobaculia bacterium]|nr:Tol-Pal system beta propeller repeat protein TolB [Thermoanaerobaculia bacterium]
MPRSSNVRSLLLLLPFLLGPMLVALPLAAQQPLPDAGLGDRDDVRVEITKDQARKVKLAITPSRLPVAPPPEAGAAIAELEKTLRDDLGLSGVFDIQGPEMLTLLELSGEREQDLVKLRSVGNEVALYNEVRLDRDRVVVDGRMYDLASGAFILGKSYTGTYDLSRRMAHIFADEIVRYFTGRRGVALTSIAFISDRDGRRADGQAMKELYLMDYDGYGQRRTTGHRSLTFSPDWAPNGSGLAYVSYFEGNAALYWVERATGEKRGIVGGNAMTLSPSFSPDGRRVAYAQSVDGNFEIFVANRDGSGAKQITHSAAIDTNPAWSPSGRTIAFTSSRAGTPQIFVMDVDGGNLRRVTLQGRYNDGAAWHPDGQRIAFSHRSEDGRRFDIAVVELATLDLRRLTAAPGNHESPTFSPDGRFIAFESDRSGGRQIFLMTAEGSLVKQLTSAGNNNAPSWSGYLE